MADDENDILHSADSLYDLAVPEVSLVIFNAWNFSMENKTIDISELRQKYDKYLSLDPGMSSGVITYMLDNGPLSFGQAVYTLECSCNTLRTKWLAGINLQHLRQVISPKAKDSVLGLYVNSDDITDIEFIDCFKNLKQITVTQNALIANEKLHQILIHCRQVEELNLNGCNHIDDDFFNALRKVQTIQDNLIFLDICGTSVSPAMAASLYFLLPQLHQLLYHDISGFLRYRCDPITFNENVNYSRKMHKLQLGDLGYQCLQFACDDKRICKEMDLLLPNYYAETNDFEGHTNPFWFHKTEGVFNFDDVYKAMCSVAPHFIFGCCPDKSYLNEIWLFNVANVDLNVLFSDFHRLTKLSLYRSCTIASLSPKTSIAENLRELELCFVSSEVVGKTMKHCPNLECLLLHSVSLASDTFKDVNVDSIKRVKVIWCQGSSVIENVFRLPTQVEIILKDDS